MYSGALWPEEIGGVRGDLTEGPFPGDLEAAQKAKINAILDKARVKAGHRVLEFGTGWGAMSIAAAKRGCTVDSLTLSIQQKKFAEERIKAAGLESRITVHLLDYRNLPAEFKGVFDSFIAIEMVEVRASLFFPDFPIADDAAINAGCWAQTFRSILEDPRLGIEAKRSGDCHHDYRPTGMEIHNVAVRSSFSTASSHPLLIKIVRQNDYAREYQWPNTFCPCATPFLDSAYSSVKGRFVVDGVDNWTHRTSYAFRESLRFLITALSL